MEKCSVAALVLGITTMKNDLWQLRWYIPMKN